MLIKLLNEDNTYLGIFSITLAILIGKTTNKHLININRSIPFPLYKLTNPNLHKFRLKKQKKIKSSLSIKKLFISPLISSNDFKTKSLKILNFLRKKHQVKLLFKIPINTYNLKVLILELMNKLIFFLSSNISFTKSIKSTKNIIQLSLQYKCPLKQTKAYLNE